MMSRHRLLWLESESQCCVTREAELAAAGYLVHFVADPTQAAEILSAGTTFEAVVMPVKHHAALRRVVAQYQPHAAVVINAESTQALIEADMLGQRGFYLAQPWQAESALAVLASALQSRLEPLRAGICHGEFSYRTLEQAAVLADGLICGCAQRASIVSGVMELLVNAVEHGNLGFGYDEKGSLKRTGRWEQELATRLQDPGYAARYARVEIWRDGGDMVFTVYDNGSGFDWRSFVDIDLHRLLAPNGRGIALAHMAGFKDITFLGSGNRVRVSLFCDTDVCQGYTEKS